jgi:hypothetical protein
MKKNSYDFLARKLEEGPLGRPGQRGVDNIKIYHKEIGWDV